MPGLSPPPGIAVLVPARRASTRLPEKLLLAEHGDEARILAGGQSLMPTLAMRLSRPALLIDINHLEHLAGAI